MAVPKHSGGRPQDGTNAAGGRGCDADDDDDDEDEDGMPAPARQPPLRRVRIPMIGRIILYPEFV